MFTKQFTRLTDALIENGKCEEEDKENIIYGLSMGIELLFNFISALLVGLCFGMLIECIVFLIVFNYLRTYAGGYHCEKAINCYFTSIAFLVLVLVSLKYIPTYYAINVSFIILILSIPIIIKFAPTESSHQNFDEDEFRYYRKKTLTNLGIECLLIAILVMFKQNTYVLLVSLSIFTTSFSIILQKLSNLYSYLTKKQ